MRKLTVDDIKDHREYERERDELRRRIIALKKLRRVALGDLMTLVFENTDTMRWQVQEMARAERMLTDTQIAHEVATYNELVPEAGELSATLLIELTSDALLREWLPKLVGIDRAICFDLADGSNVAGEPRDAERLTREETTAAVHFLRFRFTPEQVDALTAAPPRLRSSLPTYPAEVVLSSETHEQLVGDLRGEG